MKDDLFERLRAVDPVTDEQIAQETRALGNAPGRITENEPTNVRRFPAAARRKATLVAVAAVVVVAIALPLTLLRSLGDGGNAPADEPGNWVAVGTLAEITPLGVVYRAEIGAFLVARIGGDPLALSATDPGAAGRGQRAIYCRILRSIRVPGGRRVRCRRPPCLRSRYAGIGPVRRAGAGRDGGGGSLGGHPGTAV